MERLEESRVSIRMIKNGDKDRIKWTLKCPYCYSQEYYYSHDSFEKAGNPHINKCPLCHCEYEVSYK